MSSTLNNSLTTGIAVSLTLHVAVYLALAHGWSLSRPDAMPEPDVVPIEIATIDDVTRVPTKAEPKPEPEPDPEPEPEPEPAPEPEPTATAPPPEPTLADVPPPEPEPAPEPKPAPQPKPEPKPAAKPAPVVTPVQKPKPPNRLDLKRIAALIDKAKEESPPPAPDRNQQIAEAVQRSQTSSLDAKRATATLIAAARAQVERCWNPPLGAKDIQDMQVVLLVNLNPDGSLRSAPTFDGDARARMQRDPFYRTLAESTQRAVQRCAPLELPRESYEQWRSMRLVFDPREMVN